MKVSVVIRTFNRPEVVKRLLARLNKQSCNDFEVVLVCQGSRDECEGIKRDAQINYPLKYCYQALPEAARARNTGIEQSAGEIILFLDDDLKPADNLIEAHLANYADQRVGIVGGRVLEEKRQKDIPAAKIGMVRRFDGYGYDGFHQDVKVSVMHVKGGNMSVKRQVAFEVGGFDERFAGSAEYEEFDFCLRVLKKGYRIIYEPKAVIEHFALRYGGCHYCIQTQEQAVYWLYRNHTLAFINNFNKLFLPVLIVECILRLFRRSLISLNPGIIKSGLKGFRDGWKTHFGRPQKGLLLK